jgi:hypothetical protein
VINPRNEGITKQIQYWKPRPLFQSRTHRESHTHFFSPRSSSCFTHHLYTDSICAHPPFHQRHAGQEVSHIPRSTLLPHRPNSSYTLHASPPPPQTVTDAPANTSVVLLNTLVSFYQQESLWVQYPHRSRARPDCFRRRRDSWQL